MRNVGIVVLLLAIAGVVAAGLYFMARGIEPVPSPAPGPVPTPGPQTVKIDDPGTTLL